MLQKGEGFANTANPEVDAGVRKKDCSPGKHHPHDRATHVVDIHGSMYVTYCRICLSVVPELEVMRWKKWRGLYLVRKGGDA